VFDGDWRSVPTELAHLPLTRLCLRYADFSEPGWLPADAGVLGTTLRELALPGCQIR
jgi:hypothetical protein